MLINIQLHVFANTWNNECVFVVVRVYGLFVPFHASFTVTVSRKAGMQIERKREKGKKRDGIDVAKWKKKQQKQNKNENTEYEERRKIQHRRWFKTMVICIYYEKWITKHIHSVAHALARLLIHFKYVYQNAWMCAAQRCVSVFNEKSRLSHVISYRLFPPFFANFVQIFRFFCSWLCKIWREKQFHTHNMRYARLQKTKLKIERNTL